MAKGKKSTVQTIASFRKGIKKKNKGVHAKSKTSKNKRSKNYKKPYRSQGK